MNYSELEIKILNVEEEDIRQKLDSIGAKYIETRVQKIYTYDCYEPLLMYKLAVENYKLTKSKSAISKIKNIIGYINPIITDLDRKIFLEVLGKESIEEYLDFKNFDVNKLYDSRILKIIEDSKSKFFKWIRLRQDGEKVELTIKYIYNSEAEYGIDEVKEVEILVDDFETANKLVEEMGYYREKLTEKRRVSYTLDGLEIEIDTWPLIKTYVEIEGKDVDKIYEVAKKLGYEKEDTKVMNTEDVFLLEGKNITDYEVLSFDEQIKK